MTLGPVAYAGWVIYYGGRIKWESEDLNFLPWGMEDLLMRRVPVFFLPNAWLILEDYDVWQQM